MKKMICFSFILAAVFVLSAGKVRKSAGPPGCYAGEPPNNFDCTSCHSLAPVNTGTATVLFDVGGADTGYVPGQTYTINVSIKKAGMQAAGFEFVALQNNDVNTSPGSIILTQPIRTQKVDINNPHVQGCGLLQKVWVEHTYQGILSDSTGESSWSFQWQAPNTDVGAITFYLATLETNYDGQETGDYVYTQSKLSPGVITHIAESNNPIEDIILYPNPVVSELHVKSEIASIQKIDLIDMQGKWIKHFDPMGSYANTDLTLDLRGVNPGVYFLAIQGKDAKTLRKIVIQKQGK